MPSKLTWIDGSFYYEWVFYGAEYFILVADVVYLLSFDQLYFFHDFDAWVVSAFFIFDQLDSSEGAYSMV
jgi:hypothetical protein